MTDAAVDLEREVPTRRAARDVHDSWKHLLGERRQQLSTNPVLSRAELDAHHRALLLDFAAAGRRLRRRGAIGNHGGTRSISRVTDAR